LSAAAAKIRIMRPTNVALWCRIDGCNRPVSRVLEVEENGGTTAVIELCLGHLRILRDVVLEKIG
jgi:hypothetical protein